MIPYTFTFANWGASTNGLYSSGYAPHYVSYGSTSGAWMTLLDHEHLRQGALAYDAAVTGRVAVYYAQQLSGSGASASLHFRLYDLDNATVVLGPLDAFPTATSPDWFVFAAWTGVPTFATGDARVELQYAVDDSAVHVGDLKVAAALAEVYLWP